jgi:predicted O-methyltransferase YrrM
MPVMQALDANSDGEISAAELQNAAAALKALDRNGDGTLAGEEIRPRFERGPRGGPAAGPRGPRRGEAASGGSPFENPLLAKDETEKKILAALQEVRRGPRFRNVPEADGRLLRQFTEAVGAKRVVEVGTSTGESAIWMAMALRRTGGKLITHEIDEGRARTARENFKKAGVDDLITVIVGDAHETVKQHKDPIDVLFLDADKQGYIDYLNKLLPLVRPGGVVIAHNMSQRMADPRFVEAITTNPNLETLFYTVERPAVSVTLKKR